MPAYKITTGTNTAGSWHAELRHDPDDPGERGYPQIAAKQAAIGVVNGYGLDEAAAVGDALRKAKNMREAV